MFWPLTQQRCHAGENGFEKKRQREKNAVEQQAGRETEGGERQADKGGLTCCDRTDRSDVDSLSQTGTDNA